MMSVKNLLNRLKRANLKELNPKLYQKYLVDENDCTLWKNRKEDFIVNDFYVSRYEIWNNRLIKRVFYVCQKWLHKQKIQYAHEVQRYLAGSRYKINKGIYCSGFGGSVCQIHWKNYENCEWFESVNDRFVIWYDDGYYHRNQTKSNYLLNDYRSLLVKTKHKYCAFDKSGLADEKMFWYLYQYERHPQLEMIAKMNLMWMVEGNLTVMRWSQKGWKVFGLENKDELKLVQLCEKFGGLKYYRKNKQAIKKFNLDTVIKLNIYNILKARQFNDICQKTINYINQLDHEKYIYCSSRTSDYIDYIGFCNTLGIPLTSEVRYPLNFNNVHDQLQDQIKINKSQITTNKIIDFVNDVLLKYRFADNDFIITPANSVEDLITESKVLNHCVRTYSDRYSRRETAIFLIRKRKDVLNPYYTLELNNKEIRQIRGKNNCGPTNKVKRFIKKWAHINKIGSTIQQDY